MIFGLFYLKNKCLFWPGKSVDGLLKKRLDELKFHFRIILILGPTGKDLRWK